MQSQQVQSLLPEGLSVEDALELLQEGASGRMCLEARIGHLICGMGNCLLKAEHAGKCACLYESGPRKRKAKEVFEPEALRGSVAAALKASPSKERTLGWELDSRALARPKPAATPSRKSPARRPAPSGGRHLPPQPSERPMLPLLCAPSSARYEGGEPGPDSVSAAAVELEQVPNMRTAPTFLNTNAQAHPNPFSPIADLADNALEAGASRFQLELSAVDGLSVMTMTDDGRGMSEVGLLDGPLSLAYTGKAGSHYGMGATTSIPAIGPFALVLSSTGRQRTVGCISSELSVKIGADQTKMPQCSWEDGEGGFRLIEARSADAPLTAEARRASLSLMTSFGPFRSEHDLLREFDNMPLIGTRIILWGAPLDTNYCRDGVNADVLNVRAPPDALAHARSLRGFLSILYYTDDELPAPMEIWLMGKKVTPRNWSSFLYTQGTDKYKPHDHSGEPAQLRFGHTVPLMELRDNFKLRVGNKEKDLSLQTYRGIFYYNRDQDKTRLILPLQQSKVQLGAGGGAMAVTERRICEWGFGLVGTVIESHLRPAHNKSEYLSQETNVTFQTLKKVVDEKMRSHLRGKVLPAYRQLQNHEEGAGATTLGAYDAKRAAGETTKPSKPKPVALPEGLRVRGPHGVIGRTVSEGRGRYLLQLEDGSIDYRKAFFASELTPTHFDEASDMPDGYRGAPVTLHIGARVAVMWVDSEMEESTWEHGQLVTATNHAAAQQGWLAVQYDGGLESEDLFLALAENERYMAFRADGEELHQGRDFRLLEAMHDAIEGTNAAIDGAADNQPTAVVVRLRFRGLEAATSVGQAASQQTSSQVASYCDHRIGTATMGNEYVEADDVGNGDDAGAEYVEAEYVDVVAFDDDEEEEVGGEHRQDLGQQERGEGGEGAGEHGEPSLIAATSGEGGKGGEHGEPSLIAATSGERGEGGEHDEPSLIVARSPTSEAVAINQPSLAQEAAAASALLAQTQVLLDTARAQEFGQLAALLARQHQEQEELVQRLLCNDQAMRV